MSVMNAIGILREVQDENFLFLVTFLQEVLWYIDIPNIVLQAESENLNSAISIIDGTKDQIRKLKDVFDEENVSEIMELDT